VACAGGVLGGQDGPDHGGPVGVSVAGGALRRRNLVEGVSDVVQTPTLIALLETLDYFFLVKRWWRLTLFPSWGNRVGVVPDL
jgi:hypothetical protein